MTTLRVELFQEFPKLNLYSFSLNGIRKSAFEIFLTQYKGRTEYKIAIAEMVASLTEIGKQGAERRLFHQEAWMKGRLYRLCDPLTGKANFKVFCLIINENCVIIGDCSLNHSEDKGLTNENARIMYELDKMIDQRMGTDDLKIVDGKLTGDLKFRLP